MIKKKEPDLEIVRDLGYSSEAIQFYIDGDYLEISSWNCDDDSFLIILSPDEVKLLKDLIDKII